MRRVENRRCLNLPQSSLSVVVETPYWFHPIYMLYISGLSSDDVRGFLFNVYHGLFQNCIIKHTFLFAKALRIRQIRGQKALCIKCLANITKAHIEAYNKLYLASLRKTGKSYRSLAALF